MYELIQAAEHTYYMDCPSKIGMVDVGGGKGVFIDSGLDKDAAKKALRHLEALGLTLEAVYCTHSHSDHIGGCHFLQEKTGCAVFAPRAELSFVEHPELEPAFLYGGLSPNVLHNKFLLAQPCDARPLTAQVLPEGWDIRFLGGHTFSMALLKTPDGVWFVGDAVASEATLEKYPVSYLVDVERFLEDLDVLQTLEGVQFIPAHAPACGDLTPLAEVNRQNTLAMIGTVKELCREPATGEELVKRLFDRLGHTLNWNQYVLVGSTLRSYLAFLWNRGELVTDIVDNRLLWHWPEEA